MRQHDEAVHSHDGLTVAQVESCRSLACRGFLDTASQADRTPKLFSFLGLGSRRRAPCELPSHRSFAHLFHALRATARPLKRQNMHWQIDSDRLIKSCSGAMDEIFLLCPCDRLSSRASRVKKKSRCDVTFCNAISNYSFAVTKKRGFFKAATADRAIAHSLAGRIYDLTSRLRCAQRKVAMLLLTMLTILC